LPPRPQPRSRTRRWCPQGLRRYWLSLEADLRRQDAQEKREYEEAETERKARLAVEQQAAERAQGFGPNPCTLLLTSRAPSEEPVSRADTWVVSWPLTWTPL
jgi:hypothetical protein